ncbi:MAG: beta-galactosidase, partial [Paramuribaculum sp.]|nr:beta-galactosidase [Paramuribaculum sp.]
MAMCQPLSASQDPGLTPYEPIIQTLPDHTAGTVSNRMSLDGKWQAKVLPKGRWHTVNVPGELAMQGISVEHGQTVTYRRKFTVPADFAGKRTIIRFNGAYSYATLRINGRQVRTHRGGFTRWDTDITPYITPGRINTVELDLTDPVEEISYASGYAHHPIAGILRDVVVFSRPEHFFTDLRIDAELDSTYRDGTIKISLDTDFDATPTADGITAEVKYDGKTVATRRFALRKGKNDLTIPIDNPAKWDAEHPNLYDITLRMTHNGNETARVSKQAGFRKIEIDGNRMLVNGKPVKLRGACRHDIHPTLGRSTDRRTDSIDATLFKEANMNFVRTSH